MIRRQAAFQNPGTFLKGNLHCHTTRSDGSPTPEAAVALYAASGYDFLALTDHRLYNTQTYGPRNNMLILPGMEVDATLPGPGTHCVHVVAIGPEKGNGFSQDDAFPRYNVEEMAQVQPMIDALIAANNLPIFCHPEWSGNTIHDLEALQGYSLLEVWNSGCAIETGQDLNATMWDQMLFEGRKIYGVATDDSHRLYQDCRGYVMVKAEKNVDSILNALKTGAFYASCGPEIYDFYLDEAGTATVVCSPVSCIQFRSFRAHYPNRQGNAMRGDQVHMREGTRYIRAEVVDAQGLRAWTNPIFLDD